MTEEIYPDFITRLILRSRLDRITGDRPRQDGITCVNSTQRTKDGTAHFIIRSQWVATVKRSSGRARVHLVPCNGVCVN